MTATPTKATTIRLSAPASPATIPCRSATAGEVGGSEAGAGGEQHRDEHQRHLPAIGAQQPDHPAHLAPALVLAAQPAPDPAALFLSRT